MSSMIARTQSLMCVYNNKDGKIYIEAPNRQVKKYYKVYGVEVPKELAVDDYTESLYD